MLRINQITCPIDHTEKQLFTALCHKLKCRESDILDWNIARQSVDARKKPRLFYSYTLLAKCREEDKLLKNLQRDRDITKDNTVTFRYQVTGKKQLTKRPVIIGTGPAGLFCGLELARAGFRPLLLERGKDVEQRSADVEAFWNGEALCLNSNVQFGEGGAGTFSDGKLNTLVKDKYGRNTHVLKTFVEFGAKKSILYDQKPHLGTDVLKNIVKNMREEIISLGGEVRFESQMTDIQISNTSINDIQRSDTRRNDNQKNYVLINDLQGNDIEGLRADAVTDVSHKSDLPSENRSRWEKEKRIAAVEINNREWIETDILVLAIGHSARDTISMLYEKRLDMEAKPFAVGFRVQHPQAFINETQYGTWEGRTDQNGNTGSAEDAASLPGAAPYKLTAKAKDGRGVYSFCMCPGGFVVNASSEKGLLAVNGMSYSKRDGDNANSAIIVSVSPEDYGSPDLPLSGITFQWELEKRAYEAARGKIPIQKYRDFQTELVLQGLLPKTTCSELLAPFSPALKGLYQEADITRILPPTLNTAFIEGMSEMDQKIHGFASGEVWLCGIESRTSSPVRINRDHSLQSNIEGIYPCGEGAGYAGGITSAAMDGIKTAEEIGALYHP